MKYEIFIHTFQKKGGRYNENSMNGIEHLIQNNFIVNFRKMGKKTIISCA